MYCNGRWRREQLADSKEENSAKLMKGQAF